MKLAKKMMKKITYCLNLKKYMRHLIMQNSFAQKMMELNMTLTFPYKDNVFKTKEKEESEENKIFEYIEMNQKVLTMSCLKNILMLQHLLFWQKKFYETKDKNKSNELVNVIKSGLHDLKDEIEEMFDDEKKIEQPDKILKVVKEILNFNKKIQKQSGQGLKILAPDQMLSRLPINLAQLKARNNSEKT